LLPEGRLNSSGIPSGSLAIQPSRHRINAYPQTGLQDPDPVLLAGLIGVAEWPGVVVRIALPEIGDLKPAPGFRKPDPKHIGGIRPDRIFDGACCRDGFSMGQPLTNA